MNCLNPGRQLLLESETQPEEPISCAPPLRHCHRLKADDGFGLGHRRLARNHKSQGELSVVISARGHSSVSFNSHALLKAATALARRFAYSSSWKKICTKSFAFLPIKPIERTSNTGALSRND